MKNISQCTEILPEKSFFPQIYRKHLSWIRIYFMNKIHLLHSNINFRVENTNWKVNHHIRLPFKTFSSKWSLIYIFTPVMTKSKFSSSLRGKNAKISFLKIFDMVIWNFSHLQTLGNFSEILEERKFGHLFRRIIFLYVLFTVLFLYNYF